MVICDQSEMTCTQNVTGQSAITSWPVSTLVNGLKNESGIGGIE